MNQTDKHKNNQRKIAKYLPKLKRGTRHELILMDRLKLEGIWFKHNTYYYNEDKLYFPDFLLRKQYGKLIVEIDGKNHERQKERDAERSKWLKKNRNCEVIRFTNEEVETNIDSVIEKIKTHNPKTVNQSMTERYCSTLNSHIIPIDENGMYSL